MKERIEEINKADTEMINSHCDYTRNLIRVTSKIVDAGSRDDYDFFLEALEEFFSFVYKSAWIHGVKHERERIEAMK